MNINPVQRNIKVRRIQYKVLGRNIKLKFTKIICLTIKKDKKMATRFISFEKFKNYSFIFENISQNDVLKRN